MNWSAHLRHVFVHLGEDVAFTHGTADPATVRGIFTSPYMALAGGIGPGVAGANPVFAAMSADLPLVAQDDRITRGTVNYTVVETQPDVPGGFTLLQLRSA